ncbi:unknown [Clostridium sp. CAG:628]|jgi:hypothetical protein|nr:unknown [Clostridium sp. CAG:628]
MFKESKQIETNINKIKNTIELNKIIENSRVDRTETCFSGKSRLTEKEYLENSERAKKLSKKWF